MMTHSSAIFQVHELSFRYSQSTARVLKNLNASIPSGSITCILGPNGSGKSTLLHILLGLLKPEKGQVLLKGQPYRNYTRRAFSQLVGFVPQDEHVTFELDVLQYTLLGRAPYLGLLSLPQEADRAMAWQALETVGLEHLAHRQVPGLSGGEKQLATIARALAQDPKVLLLDEPTSHLDLANARRILGVLHSLRRQGRTVVCTTHDPNAAAAIADQVLLLHTGQIIAQGPTHEVISSELLSATYDIPVEVIQVSDRPIVLCYLPD